MNPLTQKSSNKLRLILLIILMILIFYNKSFLLLNQSIQIINQIFVSNLFIQKTFSIVIRQQDQMSEQKFVRKPQQKQTPQTPQGQPAHTNPQDDIFQKKVYYSQKDYFKTKSKNLISKKCLIKSSDNIEIYDHAILQQKIILRADLAKIFIGRYVILNEGVIIKPPFKKQHNQIRHIPIQIGSHVFVDKGTIIQAMKIGSYVKIGKDCIIGPRVVIGDCCIILDGTIVPADAQLASSSVYGGKPALYMGEITESASIVQKYACISYFQNFIQTKNPELLKKEQKKEVKKQQSIISTLQP